MNAALQSAHRLVVIRATTGLGKTALALALVGNHARKCREVIVSVPTHALGDQILERLKEKGIAATTAKGVASIRLPGSDEPVCRYVDAARSLSAAGISILKTLCVNCPERAPQGRDPCQAYKRVSAGSHARVRVRQHAMLAVDLAAETAKLKEKGGVRLFVIDELPPLTVTVELTRARSDLHHEQASLSAAVRAALMPLLDAVLSALDSRPPNRATLRQLALQGGMATSVLEDVLHEVRGLDGQALWSEELLRLLAAQKASHNDSSRYARLKRVRALCDTLIDASHRPDSPLLWVDNRNERPSCLVTVARWTRHVQAYVEAGGCVRLLDATAPLEALRLLWNGKVESWTVDALDAGGVARACAIWADGTREGYICGGCVNLGRVQGPLRRIAEAAYDRKATRVGIVTTKPLADALREWQAAPDENLGTVPKEFARMAARIRIGVLHYGGLRGRNDLEQVDLLATLGDCWPNVGEARAQGAALGVDPDRWLNDRTLAELLQALGRARTIHRTKPVLLLHQGTSELIGELRKTHAWSQVEEQRVPMGAPPIPSNGDASSWPEERKQRKMSQKAHANLLGHSLRTYQRRIKEAKEAKDGQPRQAVWMESVEEWLARDPHDDAQEANDAEEADEPHDDFSADV